MKRVLLALGMVSLIAASGRGAEPVTLKVAGKIVKAEVLSVTEKTVDLKIEGRAQTLPAGLLEPASLYLCQKARRDPNSAKDCFELGMYCLAKKLPAETEREFSEAKRLNAAEYGPKIEAALAAANGKALEEKRAVENNKPIPEVKKVSLTATAQAEVPEDFMKKYKDAATGVIKGQIDGTTLSPHPAWAPKFDPHAALTYALFVPEIKAGERFPLLVSLHGAGDTEAPYMNMWKGHGEKNRWMILAPKSMGPTWTPYCMVRIVQLIEEFKAKYPVDAKRIYVHGYSNGGNTAALLASVNPGLFAAAVCIHGFPSRAIAARQEGQNLKGTRIFAVAGGKDPCFPLAQVKDTCEGLKEIGVQVTLHERPDAAHNYPSDLQDKLIEFFNGPVVEKAK